MRSSSTLFRTAFATAFLCLASRLVSEAYADTTACASSQLDWYTSVVGETPCERPSFSHRLHASFLTAILPIASHTRRNVPAAPPDLQQRLYVCPPLDSATPAPLCIVRWQWQKLIRCFPIQIRCPSSGRRPRAISAMIKFVRFSLVLCSCFSSGVLMRGSTAGCCCNTVAFQLSMLCMK